MQTPTLPGIPNIHSHAFQRAMAGLAERQTAQRDSFWTWRALMYRFLDHLTPEDVQASLLDLAPFEELSQAVTAVSRELRSRLGESRSSFRSCPPVPPKPHVPRRSG